MSYLFQESLNETMDDTLRASGGIHNGVHALDVGHLPEAYHVNKAKETAPFLSFGCDLETPSPQAMSPKDLAGPLVEPWLAVSNASKRASRTPSQARSVCKACHQEHSDPSLQASTFLYKQALFHPFSDSMLFGYES